MPGPEQAEFEKTDQGQLENKLQSAERWASSLTGGLGRSEAKKLICMKRKGRRKRKKSGTRDRKKQNGIDESSHRNIGEKQTQAYEVTPGVSLAAWVQASELRAQ